MLRRPGIFRTTVIVVGVVTVALIIVFARTRGIWFDALKPEQKVQFWNEALVAYGTLALAATTVASVYETQQVLLGEDRRFRQSLMPVLRLSGFDRSLAAPSVSLTNVGLGAARNVRLYLEATVDWRWNDQGTADNRDKHLNRTLKAEDSFVTSYLESKDSVGALLLVVGEEGDSPPGMMASPDIQSRILRARIVYQDIFGSAYETKYVVVPEEGIIWQRFDWNPPAELVAEKAL